MSFVLEEGWDGMGWAGVRSAWYWQSIIADRAVAIRYDCGKGGGEVTN